MRLLCQNPRIEEPVDQQGRPRRRVMQATEMRLEVRPHPMFIATRTEEDRLEAHARI